VAHRAKQQDVFGVTIERIVINMMNYKKIQNLSISAMITFLSGLKGLSPLRFPSPRVSIGVDNLGLTRSLKATLFRACRFAPRQRLLFSSCVDRSTDRTFALLPRTLEYPNQTHAGGAGMVAMLPNPGYVWRKVKDLFAARASLADIFNSPGIWFSEVLQSRRCRHAADCITGYP